MECVNADIMKPKKSETDAAKKLEELKLLWETAEQQKARKQQRAQLLKQDKKKLESELQRTKLEGQIALQRYDTKVTMLQKEMEHKPKVIVKQDPLKRQNEEESRMIEIYEVIAKKFDRTDLGTDEGVAAV